MIDYSSVQRILIIKLKGIGDVILSTIVLDDLRARFPNARIDFLTEPPSRVVLEPLKQINRVVILDKKKTFSALTTILKVRFAQYDLVIDFYANPRTALITFLSGAPLRAGFPYRGRSYAYNIKGPEERATMHSAALHRHFLNVIGIPAYSNRLYAGITDEAKVFAKQYFAEKKLIDKNVLIVSPSGGWESKKCDPDIFAKFAAAISNKHHLVPLIVWGPGDKSDAEQIHQLLTDSLLAPATTISEMAALVELSKAVIANDSGPMHISAAIGTPTLSIHGPTDPKLQGPFGAQHSTIRLDELECIGCNLLNCPKKHECFTQLPVERVVKEFDAMISGKPTGSNV